jgi:CrcB protein
MGEMDMNVWAVGLFGVVGALLRYGTGIAVQGWWAQPFPLGTLLVNYAGCLVLGWYSAWASAQPRLPAWVRVGFGTGFVGSFTTFSTFSVETVALFQAHREALGLLYVALSFAGGLAFAWAGTSLSERNLQRQEKQKGAVKR